MAIEIETTTERNDARTLWLFSHPMRIRIIRLLLDNPDRLMVQDLARLSGLAQPTVSHHLRYFEAHNLVACRRAGLKSFYSVRPEKIREAQAVLGAMLGAQEATK